MNSGDNSHLVVVPSGSVLSDNLYNTPLFQGEGQGFAGAEAGAGGDAEVSLHTSPCLLQDQMACLTQLSCTYLFWGCRFTASLCLIICLSVSHHCTLDTHSFVHCLIAPLKVKPAKGSPCRQGQATAQCIHRGGTQFTVLSPTIAQGMNFGIDPNLDPELALALRVSLEEERARQEQAQAATGGDAAMSEAQPASGDTLQLANHASIKTRQTMEHSGGLWHTSHINQLEITCKLYGQLELPAKACGGLKSLAFNISLKVDHCSLYLQERLSQRRMVRVVLRPLQHLTSQQKWLKQQSRWRSMRTTCCSRRWPCQWQAGPWRLTPRLPYKLSRRPLLADPCLTATMRSCRMPSGCPCQRCSLERTSLPPPAL